MKKILLLATGLYLLLAPITYHPDTKLVLSYATLGNGKVWDIYSYLNKNPNDAPKFHYPPLHFWLVKMEMPLVRLIGGQKIISWLSMGGNVAFEDQNIFLYNLATKMPLLLLILATGWLLSRLALNYNYSSTIANRVAMWWLFNPITLYSGVLMGQNDILAIFLFVLGWYCLKKYPWLAFSLFGLSGAVKTYPLIWAIFIGMTLVKETWIKKMMLTAASLVVYLLSLLPFLRFDYFRQDVIYSGLSIRIFESSLNIGLGDKILVVPLLLVALLLIGIAKNIGKNLASMSLMLIAVNTIILGWIHFHPQWLMWLIPFASIWLAINNEEILSWTMLIGVLILVVMFFDDKYLYWGIVAPINPGVINLPIVSEWLDGKGVQVDLVRNLAHSIMAGLSGYWFWKTITYDK